jgi:signal transduction histidine kinase
MLSAICIAQQNKKIDSLINALEKQKDDTSKVNTLNELARQFLIIRKVADAKKYSEDALVLAKKIDFKKGVTNSYISLGNVSNLQGNIFYSENNYPDALNKFLDALKIYERNNAKKEVPMIHRNIGLVYMIEGHYLEAIKSFLITLRLYEEIHDSNAVARAYNDIGNVYSSQNNYPEALNNYLISLKKYEAIGDKVSMINRFFNIGFIYDDQNNESEALKNFSSALKISQELGYIDGIAASYCNIADIYAKQGKAQSDSKQKKYLYNESLNNYFASLENYKKTSDTEGLAICYNGIGSVYLELKKFSKAKQFLNDGLALFKKTKPAEYPDESTDVPAGFIRDNYQLLSRLDSASGDWEGAYKHYKLFLLYRDSLVNEESAQKTIKAQMQYEFEKQEDSLKTQQVLTDEKLKQQTLSTQQQRLLKNYLFAGLVLFGILSFFVYKNYRTRQQLKLQMLRNKIATDLHDDIGSTLSSISIFSQMAQQQSKEVIPLLETIGENSRRMLDAMADIVWTINPENDQFEKIILRMRSFAYELLGAKKIDFEFLADEEVTGMKLTMDVRKNLYLIFKEAINNMVKYSGANKALFNIKGEKNNLTMLIHDNGKGFDTGQSTSGNGLKNMKKRAEEIGAEFLIDSKPGAGTTIELKLAV